MFLWDAFVLGSHDKAYGTAVITLGVVLVTLLGGSYNADSAVLEIFDGRTYLKTVVYVAPEAEVKAEKKAPAKKVAPKAEAKKEEKVEAKKEAPKAEKKAPAKKAAAPKKAPAAKATTNKSTAKKEEKAE